MTTHCYLKLKVTYPYSYEARALLRRLTAPGQHCLNHNAVILRNDAVVGYPVSVVEQKLESGRSTWWVARDLGCEILSYTFERRGANGRRDLVHS
jgi:hypothetical protein